MSFYSAIWSGITRLVCVNYLLAEEGFFWFPRKLFGIENHLYSFYDYPELYLEICERYSEWLIEAFHYVFSRFPSFSRSRLRYCIGGTPNVRLKTRLK